MISVIMPSRGRPEKSQETYLKWQSASTNQFILSLDYDDPHLDKYLDIFPDYFKLKPTPTGEGKWGRCFSDNHVIIVNKNRSAVDAINQAASVAIGNIYIIVSDDTEPCPSWPDYIYHEANGKTDWIMKTKDGIQPWIITMPVMDLAYYNRTGNIYDPDFDHMFCDTWLTVQADISGRKITSNLLFPHLNDSIKDQVRVRSDATWQQGERTFIDKIKHTPIEDLRKITDIGMKNWIRNKTGIRV